MYPGDTSRVTNAGHANAEFAINHWEAKTPINFVARTSQSDYVEFIRGNIANACFSWTGKKVGKQQIRLA